MIVDKIVPSIWPAVFSCWYQLVSVYHVLDVWCDFFDPRVDRWISIVTIPFNLVTEFLHHHRWIVSVLSTRYVIHTAHNRLAFAKVLNGSENQVLVVRRYREWCEKEGLSNG